jgi:predicted nucleotidyltransferase
VRSAESTTLDGSLDIDALRAVLREQPVQLAVLFGSHATGTAHATSDIDIAVEFDEDRPPDPGYNDVFLGLSADLSDALGTDSVDLVDFHAVPPGLAAAIFENGVLVVGEQTRASELRRQLPKNGSELQSPRERLDAALDRIDDHFRDDDTGVPATGDTETDG